MCKYFLQLKYIHNIYCTITINITLLHLKTPKLAPSQFIHQSKLFLTELTPSSSLFIDGCDKSCRGAGACPSAFRGEGAWRWGPPWGARETLWTCFDGDLMQWRAGVLAVARLGYHGLWKTIHNGNRGWEEARCILMEPIIRPSLTGPRGGGVVSYNETRIILILPHLVTEPAYRMRCVDYNDLFAPPGAGLTGLPKHAIFLRKIDTRNHHSSQTTTIFDGDRK